MEYSSSSSSLDYEALKAQLEEKESLLIQSAHHGKDLLEKNAELYNELEERTQSFTERMERLKDENFTLSRQLEQKSLMENEYNLEIDSLRKQVNSQKDELKVMAEFRDQTQILSQHKQKIRELENQVDKYELEISQLQSQLDNKGETISRLNLQISELKESANDSSNDETSKLSEQLNEFQTVNEELRQSLELSKNDLAQSNKQVEILQSNIMDLQNELSQSNNQINTLSNQYMAVTDQVTELRAEIEILTMHDRDHKKKGNSMFSELDEKRQKAEKALMLLNSRHEALMNQYELAKKHIVRLKTQLSMVLQMASGQVDSKHVSDLEGQLSDARSEIKSLQAKLHKLERIGNGQLVGDSSSESKGSISVSHLQQLLNSKQEELNHVKSELHEKELMYNHVNQILIETQHSLRIAESKSAKLHAANIKLNLHIERIKNQQSTHSTDGSSVPVLQKIKTEKIPGFNAEVAHALLLNQHPQTTQTNPSQQSDSSEQSVDGSAPLDQHSESEDKEREGLLNTGDDDTSSHNSSDRENTSPSPHRITLVNKIRPAPGMQGYLRSVERRNRLEDDRHEKMTSNMYDDEEENVSSSNVLCSVDENKMDEKMSTSCKVIDMREDSAPSECKTQ